MAEATRERGKKIIATDMELPPDMIDAVSRVSQDDWEAASLRGLPTQRRDDVEVLLLLNNRLVNGKLFEDFPSVKLLQAMSAGVDFIDLDSIPPSVTLCSNAGAYGESIAEHVFAMVLFFAKNLERNQERLRNGDFESSKDGVFLGGKTIGVVGAGGIGRSVARVAKAFNMRVIGINTSGRPVPYFDAVWRMDRLDDLLKQSDFVVLALPLNVHTRNLIDAEKLRLMKEDAILVNVARGPIVSQADLYAHLKAHPRFRAGIDVWWRYPKKGERFSPEFPFLGLANFLGSPHDANGVPEAVGYAQRPAFANVVRFIKGEPLQRVVDMTDYAGLGKSGRS